MEKPQPPKPTVLEPAPLAGWRGEVFGLVFMFAAGMLFGVWTVSKVCSATMPPL
jgi:hypothetical protein